MSELDSGETEPVPNSVGQRLRGAREAAGLSRADIASRTKIAERHILSIEADRFGDLASSTYAIGFARAYARTVGLDEREVADQVRRAIAEGDLAPLRGLPAFEPGDPARIPAGPVAWVAAVAALVVVAIVWFLWPSYYSPAGTPPDLATPAARPSAKKDIASGPTRPPAVASKTGTVVFTASAPDVWVKFYDGQGNQLLQKIMAQGESYVVPPTAVEPRVWTARPDALAITVDGRPVPPLADRQTTVKDVPVSAAALRARPAPGLSAAPRPAETSTVSD